MGSLFMKPIKRLRITGESHLKNLIVYIHTNPFLHGISRDYRNYRWSSYQGFVAIAMAKDSITLSDGILSHAMPIPYNKILTKYFNDIDNFKYAHEKRTGLNNISNLIIED